MTSSDYGQSYMSRWLEVAKSISKAFSFEVLWGFVENAYELFTTYWLKVHFLGLVEWSGAFFNDYYFIWSSQVVVA